MFFNEKFPYKKIIDLKTSSISTIESYPFYDKIFEIKRPEDRFFRLTNEIQNLLSPEFISGVFGPSLIAISTCFLKNNKPWKYFFYLFFRDDISSWLNLNRKDFKVGNDGAVQLGKQNLLEAQIKKAIGKNTYDVMNQISSFIKYDSVDSEVKEMVTGDVYNFICKLKNLKVKTISEKTKKFLDESMDENRICKLPLITKPWI
ncbi:hypothetical protein MHBO_001328 [Bonamia ostreae]|uniref:Uncharacterized protein n=1 Tax=Bonamia ostreae TaxID=126728 RepID=A0ABV2AJ45_9EUKA